MSVPEVEVVLLVVEVVVVVVVEVVVVVVVVEDVGVLTDTVLLGSPSPTLLIAVT